VSASSRFQIGGRELPFHIIVAVESATVAGAWLDLLPSLLLAGVIAVPLAWLAGFALARQVSKPVARLTAASEAIARGDFTQRVEVNRDDEVGRLARAFTSMAQRVGERDSQMRALLANVSHDLKTPMTSITGYAQALGDGTAAPGEARRIGEIIQGEAQHVNTLLADLLYLAEIDAGQVITRSEDAHLGEIAERCVRRIDPAVQAKHLDVHLDVPADAVGRGVDPDKVERALTNVIDNAAKFAPQGGEITVAAHRTNGARPAVVCVVSNTGSAIPEADLPRIFDRFFRSDRARRSAAGSGLGLAIARELVELSGGTIAARNEPSGVAFELRLPA
jgi:signal transduction histidine kinase